MFVRNPSGLPVTLARGHVTDDFAIGVIVLESAFALGSGGLEAVELPPRAETDPPDLGSQPMWEGVSVTAYGAVAGSSAPPYMTPVVLAVGAVEERLVVFGPRRWTRSPRGGELRPSEPEPFYRVEMRWDHAFGGAYVLPPGTLPGTDLPHPGGRVVYTLNEQGVGFYRDEERALGQPLPRIERADARVQRWNDRLEPGGLAPCPQLGALRLFHLAMSRGASPPAAPPDPRQLDLDVVFRTLHHAPPRLIVPRAPGGTPIALDGMAGGPLRFEVPESPVVVQLDEVDEPVRPRARSVHVDAERRLVRITHAHVFRYAPDEAPSWILVTRRKH